MGGNKNIEWPHSMKHSRERRASLPDAYPGQINWNYDRGEIIADGAVHAIGVWLGLIGAVTIVVIAVKVEGIEITPILVYVVGPDDAGALGRLQHVAGLARPRPHRGPRS
jgi:hypothetical protein